MTAENRSSWTATLPSATLSTINLTSTGLGCNPGFRVERPASCGQSYDRPVQDRHRTMFETRRLCSVSAAVGDSRGAFPANDCR